MLNRKLWNLVSATEWKIKKVTATFYLTILFSWSCEFTELSEIKLHLHVTKSELCDIKSTLRVTKSSYAIDPSQRAWLTGDLTNHNAKSAILSNSYGQKLTINYFFPY